MAQLIYSALASLDGYIADETGRFDWSAPDEEVHAYINERERPIGTYLYGRRLYDVMVAWETMGEQAADSPAMQDYAQIWQGADKIVYSTTLDKPTSARTRIERSFEPEAVRLLKAGADRDLGIGGAGLAAAAFRAGLVDRCRLFVVPVVVGGGTRALPDGVRLDLRLAGERRFGNGTVCLDYQVAG